ncbi:MAG: transposase [bacterium]
MSNYIRLQVGNPDDLYFLTCVTRNRAPHFAEIETQRRAQAEWNRCADEAKGTLIAYVFMPDHHHVVIRQGELPFSRWVENMKRRLNYAMLQGKGTLWQPRFWEHRIHDADDQIRAVEYIHYNPVKHGFVKSPCDYGTSSFHEYVDRGEYPVDWSAFVEVESDVRYGE